MFIFTAAFLGGMTASLLGVIAERGLRNSITGRSTCCCGTVVPAWWNLPVFGWVALGGKAKCCGATIPVRYVICEAGMTVTVGSAALLGGVWMALLVGVISGAAVLYGSRFTASR